MASSNSVISPPINEPMMMEAGKKLATDTFLLIMSMEEQNQVGDLVG